MNYWNVSTPKCTQIGAKGEWMTRSRTVWRPLTNQKSNRRMLFACHKQNYRNTAECFMFHRNSKHSRTALLNNTQSLSTHILTNSVSRLWLISLHIPRVVDCQSMLKQKRNRVALFSVPPRGWNAFPPSPTQPTHSQSAKTNPCPCIHPVCSPLIVVHARLSIHPFHVHRT